MAMISLPLVPSASHGLQSWPKWSGGQQTASLSTHSHCRNSGLVTTNMIIISGETMTRPWHQVVFRALSSGVWWGSDHPTHLVAGSSRHQSSMSSSQSPWLTWHWVSPRPTSLHSCSEISASLTCGRGHSDCGLHSILTGYLAGGVLLAGLLLPGRVPALQLAALGPLHPRLEAGDQVGAGAARGQLQRQGQHIVTSHCFWEQ